MDGIYVLSTENLSNKMFSQCICLQIKWPLIYIWVFVKALKSDINYYWIHFIKVQKHSFIRFILFGSTSEEFVTELGSQFVT